MAQKILWLACFWAICYSAQAQDKHSLDSLQKAYKTAKSDTTKILILVEIGFQYFSTNVDTCFIIAKRALAQSEALGFKKGKVRSLSRIGVGYWAQGDYPKALRYFRESHDIAESINDFAGQSSALNNMGHTHYILKHFDQALEYFQKGLVVAERINNRQSYAVCLGNIGKIYIERKQYDTALAYIEKSLSVSRKIGYKRWMAENLNELGLIYRKKKLFDKALRCYEEDLALCEETGNELFMIHSLNGLAQLYQETGNFNKSIEYGLRALKTAQKIHGLRQLKDVTHTLYQTYKLKGSTEQALTYFEMHKSVNDSIFNTENDKKMSDIETRAAKAETEKKNLQLKQSEQIGSFQRYIIALVALGFASMLVFSYLIFRSRQKERADKEIISHQKEEIESTLELVEAERHKSESLLLNILPTEVAQELKETGKTEVRYFKSITALFADVKGFSALAQTISPQALIAELDETFTKMDEISTRFGLERIKTIGDCYMACGGLPHANKTHTFDTVLTALHIQHWLKVEHERRNGDFWQARLGIHTGDAVAGVIGKTKFAYDVWGRTVNLASRMESGGEVGMVNVTEQVYEEVKDFFEGEYREEIEAKNIGKVKAYFITRLKSQFCIDDIGIEPNTDFWNSMKLL